MASGVSQWADVTNIPSLVSYAGSFVEGASNFVGKTPSAEEGDSADFDLSKRKVEWIIKNFRGG